MRIVVAMSGGVDSSVAAALLARQGPRGDRPVDAALRPVGSADGEVRFGSCCTPRRPARRPARGGALGIPHYIVNFERSSTRRSSRTSCGVRAGRTPIPCVHCNGDLKFATLVERAAGLDAALSPPATTRASIRDEATGRYRLRAAWTRQGPVLLPLHADAGPARARDVPVGRLEKPAVRELARELGLEVADKPDSHEICFVPDGDHAAFVERHARRRWGPIRDQHGQVSSAGTTACTTSPSDSGRGSASRRGSSSTSSASTPRTIA
jgi:tRNA-uridine 2-sulfurtransferase